MYARAGSHAIAETGSADSGWSLPIPATYVIDQDACIALAHVDPDYRDRLEPEAVLVRLRTLGRLRRRLKRGTGRRRPERRNF